MGIYTTQKKFLTVIVLFLFSIIIAPALGADWYVSPSGDNTYNGSSSAPWQTIAYAAMENASVGDGDVIHIAAGTYPEWNIIITKNLALSGEGADATIVDGMDISSDSGGVFSAVGVTASIEDLAIRNGSVTHIGGGVYGSGSILTISDCRITDNTATGYGGGIYLTGGTALITGCVMEDNRAYFTSEDQMSGGGGGVFLQGGSLALVDSTLHDNDAMQYGGGMHVDDGTVTISDAIIADNVVDYSHGGGVSQIGGTLEILESTIENNTAGGYGGGVRCRNVDTFTLSNTSVVQNNAKYGGGISQEYGVVNVTNTFLSGNSATLSGGGVFQDRGTMAISNSTLDQNTANRYGGGVEQWEYGTLTITGTQIVGNIAQYGGGGVNSKGNVTIHNCNLRNTRNFFRENGNAILNTTVTESTNIVGGPFIGGNYWGSPVGDGFSDTCIDADGDGFGDVPYTVSGATDNHPLTMPVAGFTADPTSGAAPLTVRFTSTSLGTVASSVWDFGDGYTDTTGSSSSGHTFTSGGIYTVSFTVTDGSGYSRKSRTIVVRGSPSSSSTTSGGGVSETGVATATGLSTGDNVTLTLDPSKSAVYGIDVMANNTIRTLLITTHDAGSPGAGIPPVNGTVFQSIEVTLYQATDDQIERAEILFTVPVAWLSEEGFDAADIVLYRWHDGEWQALPTTFVKEEDGKAYFTAMSPGFSLFAIAAVEQIAVDEGEPVPPVSTVEPTLQATATDEVIEPDTTETPAPDERPDPAPTESPVLFWVPITALGCMVVLLRRRR